MIRLIPRKKRVGQAAGLLVAFGLALVAAVAASPVAEADADLGSTALIRSFTTGLCVDSNDHANGRSGGEAYSHDCNFGRWQYWQEAPSPLTEGSGIVNEFTLVDSQTGFCLDSNKSGEVYTLPCTRQSANQSWIHVMPALPVPPWNTAGPWPTVYRNAGTDRCLSIGADKGLRTVECSVGRGDAWSDDVLFRRGY